MSSCVYVLPWTHTPLGGNTLVVIQPISFHIPMVHVLSCTHGKAMPQHPTTSPLLLPLHAPVICLCTVCWPWTVARSTDQMRTMSPYLLGKYEKSLFDKLSAIHHHGHAEIPEPKTNTTRWKEVLTSGGKGPAVPVAQRTPMGENYVYPSLSRHEQDDIFKSRVAKNRAKALMMQHEQELNRGDTERAVDLLVEARMHYQEAGDADKVHDIDGALMKIRGDDCVRKIAEARLVQDYDACIDLCRGALKYYKVMASVITLKRDAQPLEVERLEEARNKYKAFLKPKTCARQFALADGREAQARAIHFLEDRHFDQAVEAVDSAYRCFEWAKQEAKLWELDELRALIEVSRHSNSGDSMVEKVARQLKPMHKKDTEGLLKDLQLAEEAFTVAQDSAGCEMTARLRSCVRLISESDELWLKLFDCLGCGRYTRAVKLLKAVRRRLGRSTRGLAFVNSRLDTVMSVVCNMHFSAHGMIADLALRDAKRAMDRTMHFLEAEDLDASQEMAAVAHACYEWVATNFESMEEISTQEEEGKQLLRKGEAGPVTAAGGEEEGEPLAEDDEDDEDDEESEESDDDGSRRMHPLERLNTMAGETAASVNGGPGALSDDARSQRLLQRFIRVFPIVKGPKQPFAVQAKARHSLAVASLRELAAVEHKLVRGQALRSSCFILKTFILAEPTFSSATANTKLLHLAESRDGLQRHGFGSLVEACDRLRLQRLGDRHLEDAIGELTRCMGGDTADLSGAGEPLVHVPGQNMPASAADRVLDLCRSATEFYGQAGARRQLSRVRCVVATVEGLSMLGEVEPMIQERQYADAAGMLNRVKARLEAAVAEDKYHDSMDMQNHDEIIDAILAADRSARRAQFPDTYMEHDEEADMEALRRKLEDVPPVLLDAEVAVSGEQLRQRAEATNDPKEMVRARACRDGEKFKANALQSILDRDLEQAQERMAVAAQCFRWAGDATSEKVNGVKLAIEMARTYMEGEAIYEESSKELDVGNREGALGLLDKAKALLHESQLYYSKLMEQAANFLLTGDTIPVMTIGQLNELAEKDPEGFRRYMTEKEIAKHRAKIVRKERDRAKRAAKAKLLGLAPSPSSGGVGQRGGGDDSDDESRSEAGGVDGTGNRNTVNGTAMKTEFSPNKSVATEDGEGDESMDGDSQEMEALDDATAATRETGAAVTASAGGEGDGGRRLKASGKFAASRTALARTAQLGEDLSDVQMREATGIRDFLAGVKEAFYDPNRIFDVRSVHDCLAMDTSLDRLATLIAGNLYSEAVDTLDEALQVFERAQDKQRAAKCNKLKALVQSVERVDESVAALRFDECVARVRTMRRVRQESEPLRPPTIVCPKDSLVIKVDMVLRTRTRPPGTIAHAPEGQLLTDEAVVRRRAIKIACAYAEEAARHCTGDDFPAAKKAIQLAQTAFAWVKKQAQANPAVSSEGGAEARAIGDTAAEVELSVQELAVEVERRKATLEATAAFDRAAGFLAESDAAEDRALRDSKYQDAMRELDVALEQYTAAGDQSKAREVKRRRAHAAGNRLLEEAQRYHASKDYSAAMEKADEANIKFKEADESELAATSLQLYAEAQGDNLMLDYKPALEARQYDDAVQVRRVGCMCNEPRERPSLTGMLCVWVSRNTTPRLRAKPTTALREGGGQRSASNTPWSV